MPWPLLFLAWSGWAAAIPAIARISQSASRTTLVAAVGWAWAAIGMFGLSLLSLSFTQVPDVLRQQACYWTGVVALCPLIAVLGAQRPGVRVWNAFVLLPLVAVLGWPALTVWFNGYPPSDLQLETPTALAFGIVALMGLGNYLLIPRWTACILLYGAAIAFTVLPLTTFVELRPLWHLAAYPSLGLAALAGWWAGRGRPAHADPLDQMWADFRDRFGLVWAARIRDRVNATAEKERWNRRLELDGFVPVEAEIDNMLNDADTRARIDHTLRWLLRRFVGDEPTSLPEGAPHDSPGKPAGDLATDKEFKP